MYKPLLIFLLMSSSLCAMEVGGAGSREDSLATQFAQPAGNDSQQRMQRGEKRDDMCLKCLGVGCVVCAGISCYACPLPTGCFWGGTAVLMAIVCARHNSDDVVKCLREIFPCISGVRRESDN